MVDISAIAGAVQSLKLAGDIAKAMIGLRDGAMISAKIGELNGALIDAQQSVFAIQQERTSLVERVRELEAEISRAKDWDAEKKKYELRQVHRGAFTYALKADAETTEPPHWICAACYQRGKKAILQDITDKAARDHSWGCPDCKTRILVPFTISPGRQ